MDIDNKKKKENILEERSFHRLFKLTIMLMVHTLLDLSMSCVVISMFLINSVHLPQFKDLHTNAFTVN